MQDRQRERERSVKIHHSPLIVQLCLAKFETLLVECRNLTPLFKLDSFTGLLRISLKLPENRERSDEKKKQIYLIIPIVLT